MSNAQAFHAIFAGNPDASYGYDPDREGLRYFAIDHGVTEADVVRHLAGKYPSVLSIPILPTDCTHFGAIDADRHKPEDVAIDHAALARKVTRLALPLIVCRSKSPKSAHLWLFLKEKDGFECSVVRQLLEEYRRRLEIDGDVEIFPKQETLKEGQKGNGINLPYFGSERFAFGKDGEELDLEGFVSLARERQAFGKILAERDLADGPSGHINGRSKADQPLPVAAVRNVHQKHLAKLRESSEAGHWNDTLNTTAYYAGRAFAAGALDGTDHEIKEAIRKAASAWSGWEERVVDKTVERSWGDGVAEPLEVSDPEKAGKEAELRILEWLGAECPPSRKPAEIFTDMALLSAETYEDLRETVAKALGLTRVTKLDEFVDKRRPAKVSEGESQVDFKPSAAWTHAVDGAQLLADIAAAVRRFIIFKNPQDAEVVATWTLGTYLYEEFGIFARLGLTSTFPESGKTTLMDFLEYSCLRAVRGDNITVSVFFRVIDEHHPSLLLDEVDTFLAKNPELVGVLNSGHKRGGYVWRTEEINGKFVSVRFATFAPVAYAGIGHPTGTLFSRTIFIRLDRKRTDQKVEDFDPEEIPEQQELMENLRRRMVRWAEDHREEVKECKPDTGPLSNRARNNWRALLKIGQIAGGGWNDILLTAAGCPPPLTKRSIQEKLLKDIRNVFHSRGVDRLPSSVLVDDLLEQKQSGWKRHHDGKTELDEADLADLLTDFGVEPRPMHIPKDVQLRLFEKAKDGKLQLRGYLLEQFAPLIATYLQGEPEEVPVSKQRGVF